MEKSALHRINSLVLAILMLFTSVGFSADLHFCKGELKSFSFFGKAESCHTIKRSCPHHAGMVVVDKSEKDCCSNKTIEVDDLDTNFNVSPDVVLTDLQVKLASSFVYSFISLSLFRVVKAFSLATHDPLPSRDIYVLLERYLI